MALRERLVALARRTGALASFRWLRPHLPLRWLTILTYHRVGEVPHGFDFDPEVLDASPAQFERQMAALRELCSPIGLGHLRDYYAGAELPPNPVLVTFDDGYRDNFETALPILRRWEVPAVFFIAVGYISQRRVFWWDRIRYLIRQARTTRLRLRYPQPLEFSLPEDRERALRVLLRTVKTHYRLDLKALLDDLTRAAGVEWDDELERRLADAHLMDWDHVRRLKTEGMEVQSHTVTHRPLHTLSASDLAHELRDSRRELEERIGAPVDALAAPVGYPLDRFGPFAESIGAAGYALGFSNGTGAAALGHAHPLQLPRVAVERDWSLARFRAELVAPPGSGRRPC